MSSNEKTDPRSKAAPKGAAHASGGFDAGGKTNPDGDKSPPTQQPPIPPQPKANAAAGTPNSGEVPTQKSRYEVWELDRLKPNPRQAELFHDVKGPAFTRFVASIKKRLDQPIEVQPDGTIIDGHQRLRAARALGWKTIRVCIRDDLAGNQKASDLRHIEANEARRQLSALDRARMVKGRMEVENGMPYDPHAWQFGRLRDLIVEEVGCSKRHANRLILILRLPMPLQKAVDEETLTLVSAVAVAGLPVDDQRNIARAVEEGSEPSQVAKAHLSQRANKGIVRSKAYREFYKAFKRFLEVTSEGLDGIDFATDDVDSELETLRRGKEVLPKSIRKLQDLKKARDATMRELLERVKDFRGRQS